MKWDEQRLTRMICLVLGLVTLAVYLPVVGFDFVNYDDSDYVYANPMITEGISLKGIWWALTESHATNWHPLTTLLLMLQSTIFGIKPGPFHLTNVLFHVANTIVLFLLMKRMLGKLWPAAIIAALFAWHPTHVESVAWVAELKDVLSTLFWLLTMWAYLNYVEEPTKRRYRITLLLYACGLMSKPMLVTLPFVLLLLDYWPLKRIVVGKWGSETGTGWFAELRQFLSALRADEDQMRKLVREKMPFLALAVVSSLVTAYVQNKGGAAASLNDFPFGARVLNSLESYVRYIGIMFWPANLTIFYPLPKVQIAWKGLVSFVALLGITAVVLRYLRRQPWLFVGWFWYVGTLVPVIGIVQVGNQAMADRYTYVPYLGLFIIVVWTITERWWPVWQAAQRKVLAMVTALVLLALLGRTFDQLFYWRNSVVLFEHALAITEHNALAHADLGVAYYQLKQDQKAYDEFKKALEINPNYHHPPMGLGRDLIGAGKPKEALKLLELVISFRPKDPEVNQLLGMALMRDGRHAEAGARFGEVLAVEPKNVQALINFGLALTASGKVTEAIEYYLQALRMDGDSVDARVNLGIAYKAQGKVPEAMEQYAMVVKQAPEMAEARMNLGLILLEQGRMAEASPHIAKWLALSPENERANFYFAVILLAEQQPGPAIAHMRKAVELRTDWAYAIATLAQVLATHPDPAVRNGAEAVKLAERANELTQGMDAEALDALAAAYAEVARFPEAVKTGEKASERAAATGRSGLAQQIQARLALYRQQKPFRQGG